MPISTQSCPHPADLEEQKWVRADTVDVREAARNCIIPNNNLCLCMQTSNGIYTAIIWINRCGAAVSHQYRIRNSYFYTSTL